MRDTALAALKILAVAAALAAATWLLSLFVRFDEPRRLWAVLAPIAVYAFWVGHEIWRRRTLARIGDAETIAELTASQSAPRRHGRAALLVLSAYFAALAFAVPQWGEESRKVERRGIDVVLAVDVSRSMLAEDVPPDRLRAAISEIEALLRSLKGDRVGLVVYAGVAFTQSPLTSDYGAIQLYLHRLNPRDISVQGTAIGRAIAEGQKLLTGGGNADFKRARHQLMIVISDGEDQETDPITAAEDAAEHGIRVYTVGLGSPEGARIPIRDRNGNLEEYLTDRNHEVVVTRLEDEQLRAIARAGNGEYIHYDGQGSVARALNDAIESFDDESLSSVLRAEYVDRPLFFLIPSALLLLAFLLLGGVRNRRAGVALLALLLLNTGCSGIERDDPAVKEAIERSQRDEHERALERIEQADDEAREQGSYWFDRGLINERAGNLDDAIDAYLRALGDSAGALHGDSMVGVGNALFGQERYAEARDRYERALRLNPDHAAARRNLEIALRHEFPPCRTLDDEYEDNDAPDDATPIPETSLTGDFAPKGMQTLQTAQQPASGEGAESPPMVICGGDSDFYSIPVHGGDTITVKATFERLRDDNGGPPLPNEIASTDVRLALLGPDGEEVLAVDQGLSDASEVESAKQVTRAVSGVEIPRAYGKQGAVYLVVEANQPLEYEYTLDVAVIPPCEALEDAFEDNDSRLAAHPVENGDQRAMYCAGDPDWYSVTVDPGDDVFVDLEPGVSVLKEPVMMSLSMEPGPDREPLMIATTEPDQLAALEARNISESGQLAFSVEGVDDAEAQYPFAVYHYPPCPEGRDRYEPNDSRNEAAPLSAKDAPVRHLRLCEGDEDWFLFTLPPESASDAGSPAGAAPQTPADEDTKNPRAFSAMADFDDASRPVSVQLFDPSTGRLLGDSDEMVARQPAPSPEIPATTDEPDDRAEEGDGSSVKPTRGQALAAAMLEPELTEVLVRVRGAEGYYHLSFPDTEAQQQQQQNQSDQQGDGEDSESEENADQNESQNDESGEQQEDAEKPEPAGSEGTDEQQSEGASATPTDEEAEREALMQLLNSLEDKDINLQLRQALDQLPPTQMRNEW